ncbi:hypothetical protein HID58_094565 [Brassica napus]|uniref:CASP-like protein n=1 Tax=Brassica napus TaxID=3708 RepID=A0ABQ7X986_BRANA|nr:hypothetical protein HID58_094565 [Brassica napus]
MAKESTTIDVGEPSTITKSSSHVVVDQKKKKGFVAAAAGGGYKRGLAIFDFLLRLAAIGITIGASSVMFTAEETLPSLLSSCNSKPATMTFPHSSSFRQLSRPFTSLLHRIYCPSTCGCTRLILLISDTVVLTLTTAAAAAAAAIVYLAHNGNANTNWLPICQQFGDFCQATSTAVVAASISVVFFVLLIESTTIEVGEPSTVTKSTSHVVVDEKKKKGFVAATAGGGYKRGLAIFDFLLRLAAIVTTITASSVMYTAEETLPFFTQFLQFQAGYDDFATFQFFVIAIAMVASYLVLSLPFSIVTIIRPLAAAPRLILLISDTVVVTLATSAAAAAAAIVYLAHNGNPNTNWLPICQQFGDFCQAVSSAVVASSIAVVFFIILIVISAIALKKH